MLLFFYIYTAKRGTMNKKTRGDLLLILTAMIWGSAFVTQKSGMDHIEPFTFNCIRMLIGSAVLVPFLKLGRKASPGHGPGGQLLPDEKRRQTRLMIHAALICGITIFVGTTLQQIGLVYTTAGKSGFITALYIIIVPMYGIFMRKRPRNILWVCVALGIGGLYLLCVNGRTSIGIGDIVTFLGAFAFAAQIQAIDYYSLKLNPVLLSCMQFLICGIISVPCMFIFETPHMAAIMSCWPQIVYTGVLSCGLAYTLQILGQRDTDPTVASLLMSLESVFAALSGAVFLGESMTIKEITGCALMFAAIILAQLPPLGEMRGRIKRKDE